MVSAFKVMASRVANCTVLKPPTIVAGKRGSPQEYLTDIDCTPIDPVQDDYELTPPLDKPVKLYRTSVDTSSIVKNGYLLTHDGTTYIVRNVNRVEWRGGVSQILILEKEEVNG